MRSVTCDALRSAEVKARIGLEPELAQRYEREPAAVLAEFGLDRLEPAARMGVDVHDLGALAREDVLPLWCVCIMSEAQASA